MPYATKDPKEAGSLAPDMTLRAGLADIDRHSGASFESLLRPNHIDAFPFTNARMPVVVGNGTFLSDSYSARLRDSGS